MEILLFADAFTGLLILRVMDRRSRSAIKNGVGTGRKFLLRSEVCFVTWSQSRIRDPREFYRKLVEVMPVGTKVFGSQEFHDDGNPHYHAVLRFPERVHWDDAPKYFLLRTARGVVDTRAIRIGVPDKGEVIEDFVQRSQAYCAKEGNERTFGERFRMTVMPSCARCRSVLGGDDSCLCFGCVGQTWREKVSVTCLIVGCVTLKVVNWGCFVYRREKRDLLRRRGEDVWWSIMNVC